MDEEEQFLRELQDVNSPLFHKFLTEEEWNARFAPTAQDEQTVVNWALSNGLAVTHQFGNRLLVDVEAPAAVIEKAFDVTLNSYQVGSRTYFSNDRDPSIPPQLAGTVQNVLGLNNIDAAHSFSKPAEYGSEPMAPDYSPGPAYAVGSALRGDGDKLQLEKGPESLRGDSTFDPFYPYAPTDIYDSAAYDYDALQHLAHCCNPLNNPGGSPPESSIAIAIWDDFADSDLNGFLLMYPYLSHNIQRYFIDGHAQCCGGEVTLDVEWATAMSNSFGNSSRTAKINVYEAPSSSFSALLDVLNHILSDGKARVLNMSWGNAEVYGVPHTTIESYHSVINQLVGQGWTLFAAAGDAGATGYCDDHLAVSYPASDPGITAVGGTYLSMYPGSFQSEGTWSGGQFGCAANDGGTGGGCSTQFAAPGYQGSTSCGSNSRSLPDIALNADWVNSPQNFFYQGYRQQTGGTSISAPMMAGFAAQENAYLLYLKNIIGDTCGSSGSAPCAPMGNVNPYLYGEGLNQPFAAHYPFYDITSGCNGNDITQQYGLTPYCAKPGFDQVSGWGSANMLQLAWTINTFLAGDFGPPAVSFSGPPVGWYNTDKTVSWSISDTSLNGHRPNGIAGYSASWDSDPGDIYAKATPGTGNSYYSGPQYPNSTTGSLDLVPAGFGCHTVNVRAWDNAGQPNADATYGPVCYDTLAPVTTIALSGTLQGGYYVSQVQITLTGTDDLSGIAATYWQVDSGPWQTYAGPFAITSLGPHTFSYYSVDRAGNTEAPPQTTSFVVIATTRSTLTISKVGSGTGSVTSADGNINCGSNCSYAYFDGTPVTLTPSASPGSVFAGWSGCDSTPGYNCYLVVLSSRTATVTFNHAPPLQFVAITPCRVVDTRDPDGPFGGPAIQGGTDRSFAIPQADCNIPSNAAAYALNVTVVPPGPLSYLTVWPTGQAQPQVSTMNSPDGRIKANAAIVPSGTSQAVSVYAAQTTDVVLDINGYFLSPGSSTLAFFAMTPCRVLDTRGPVGPLGAPALQARQERDFPILSSSCNVPSSAAAYAFNVTAIPHGSLNYLTMWPFGQSRPEVSTLNAANGNVTANATIVESGTSGEVSVYPTNDSDLVVDINGYFAPAASGANPLSLYAMIPCRALDTRQTTGAFVGTLPISLDNSPCRLNSAATAYVLNATVVPQGGPLGYLTLWPTGQTQPQASTLNAPDGKVTSNMAIVPGGLQSGSIDAFAPTATQLILDISSYFGP